MGQLLNSRVLRVERDLRAVRDKATSSEQLESVREEVAEGLGGVTGGGCGGEIWGFQLVLSELQELKKKQKLVVFNKENLRKDLEEAEKDISFFQKTVGRNRQEETRTLCVMSRS
ncbi:unnamed protein product [Fraxinus pennsylvanica]|uniref:Uncharacterized protein n=1 Tax=Fraxinus pennsylvanica TaxID=56036 RepID=A0AAD2DHN2_9LAMI|nr:unnamed protein product [Fraxinus pennsylvanica]